MKYLFGILIVLLFFGCKTPTKVTSAVQLDSIAIKEVAAFNYDSILQQIVSSLSYDFDYILIEYSKPDSSGNQYKEKEHHIKGSGKAEQETNTTHISNSNVIEKDSAVVKKEDITISEPVKTLNWWDKIRIKAGNLGIVIGFLGIGYIVIWLIGKKK